MHLIKKQFNFVTVLLLSFSLIFGPLVHEIAAESNANKIAKAKADFAPFYEQIMSLEKVELSPLQKSLLLQATALHNVTEAGKSGASHLDHWIHPGTKPANTIHHAEFVNYQKDIDTANAEIDKLQAKAKEINDLLNNGNIEKAQEKFNESGFNSVQEIVNAQGVHQQTLINAGKDLSNAGKAMEDIGSTLSTCALVGALAGLAATLTGVGAPVGATIIAISEKVNAVASGISIAGAGVKAIGDSIINSAYNGLVDDATLFGNVAVDHGVAMAKAGIGELVSFGLGKAAGTILEPLADSVQVKGVGGPVKKYLGDTDVVKHAYDTLAESYGEDYAKKLMKDKYIEGAIVSLGAIPLKKAESLLYHEKSPVKDYMPPIKPSTIIIGGYSKAPGAIAGMDGVVGPHGVVNNAIKDAIGLPRGTEKPYSGTVATTTTYVPHVNNLGSENYRYNGPPLEAIPRRR